jgi:hypothetical protein
MSKWRLKGFVQDSDDEEEDLETTSSHSNQESQYASDECVSETRLNIDNAGKIRGENKENEWFDKGQKDGSCEITSSTNTPKRAVLVRPTVSPITPYVGYAPTKCPTTPLKETTEDHFSCMTESPDPLQVLLSPRVRHTEQLPSSSISLGVPVSYQNAAALHGQNTESRPNPDGFLEQLGLGPLSDASDDDILSDPPSDMDEPIIQTTMFASPKRRTAVQVVIPRSSAVQQELIEQQAVRSLRERKPIQLHPYALEGEIYRRELQGRGIKPVARQRSPVRNSTHDDAETQEQEFNPNGNPLSSSPPEIQVSTPIFQMPRQDGHGSSTQRPKLNTGRHRLVTSSSHIVTGFKRRRLDHSTRATISLQTSAETPQIRNDDMWTVPQSPPCSSSPLLVDGNSVTRKLIRPLTTDPTQGLPTPSQSSSVQGDAQPGTDPDLGPAVRTVRPPTKQQRRPTVILSDSPSVDSESSRSESEPNETDLKQARKRMKGILPASWVRLDREAQARRETMARLRDSIVPSPERAEPQRGIAQKVMKRRGSPHIRVGLGPHRNGLVVISDESDNEVEPYTSFTLDVQQSARAAANTAAAFDHRYADDESDNMEDDRLELFTLGRSAGKRRKQTKVTDAFSTTKNLGTNHGGTRASSTSRLFVTGRRKKKKPLTTGKPRRMPLPALSVLDFDQSSSGSQAHVPEFLRVARRQARRRPDSARERPTNKHIRLHTVRDTEDANITLRQWRIGALNPKVNLKQSKQQSEGRGPLLDIDNNAQRSQHLTEVMKDPHVNSHTPSIQKTRTPRIQWQSELPLGLLAFSRLPVSSRKSRAQGPISPSSTSKQRQAASKKLRPFRAAQLEGLEIDYNKSNRRVAFRHGLQEVDRRFNLQTPLVQPSLNPQMARFLADADTALPTLPPANDVGDLENRSPTKKPPVPRRRLTRKVRAQRIDVDTRIYRQPSEPDLADIFNQQLPRNTPPEQGGAQAQLVLQGLGPHGTRYPTTFDVLPLKSDTYFHSTTFVGGLELHRALLSGSTSRDMDEATGYLVISHNTKTIRCGPWNDETFSFISDLMTSIWHPLDHQALNDSDRATLMVTIFQDSSKVLRSLIGYFSTHLSFFDPVDRQAFTTKMKQFGEYWLTRIFASNTMNFNHDITPAVRIDSMRMITYLLVIINQTHRIAQHSVIETCIAQELANMVRSVAKLVVSQLLHNVSQLSSFLERNKRFTEREHGIQDSEILVESIVVCMHVLETACVPGVTFWGLVSQELAPRAEQVTDLQTFESLWGTLFTLLPFIEIDDSGLVTNMRRTSFQDDHWVFIKNLLKRLFFLYPPTYRLNSSSLNEYVRATLSRCHRLIHFWHWNRCDDMLSVAFDFFATNGLKNLRREESNGSVRFLEDKADKHLFDIAPKDSSFHIYLKCLALGLHGMKDVYQEKKIRSIVFRLTPNHGRNCPKDQPMETESLDALRNHLDLLCTLYYASPPSCRPRLDLLRDLVHHETSHREACRLNVHAWASLTAFQLSTTEPYASAKPLSDWHKEINKQTLKQYHLAKTEAENILKSGELDKTDASSLMVRQAMEKNQEQVIATLRDCTVGMQRAIESAVDHVTMQHFLMDSGLVELLKLPHFNDARLVAVIRDILGAIRKYTTVVTQRSFLGASQRTAEESQDLYGGESLDVELLFALEQQHSDVDYKHPPLDFIQVPLWNLLSNAFGAGRAPDDNLLMDCVDTWALIASRQVLSGARSWSYYISPHGSVSWQQLSQTEQTQKFGPYFMAAFITSDSSAFTDHRYEFFNALLVSLADREASLRFQHRLLNALARVASDDPLMTNLPFFRDDQTGEFDISADTLRARRLPLISSILANMREDYHNKVYRDAGGDTELRENYSVMLKGFMTAMKSNYQQLRQEMIVTGAYVEFVQKVVQFLQQYTADICPILDFFTNSVAFPLPAADPTYVVGRLCGYAPKLAMSGVPKQLAVFVQTVAQQAAVSNQQPYLAHQLTTALCSDVAPAKNQAALRNVLLQDVFPTYIEAAFSSMVGFVIAKPILQSLKPILQATLFNIRVFHTPNVGVVYNTIMSICHAFVRSTEQLRSDAHLVRQSYVLQATSYMLDAMVPIITLLDYIYGRFSKPTTKPAVMEYLEQFTKFVTQVLYSLVPEDVPSYDGDAQVLHSRLSSFCMDELASSIKLNWSSNGGRIFFGQGHAKRDVVVDLESMDEEKERLADAITAFKVAMAFVYRDQCSDGGNGQEWDTTRDVNV